jgi:hypothetical protein
MQRRVRFVSGSTTVASGIARGISSADDAATRSDAERRGRRRRE